MIVKYKDIKVDYIYYLKDLEDYIIIKINFADHREVIGSVLSSSTYDIYAVYENLTKYSVSSVPETDVNFDGKRKWAVYEIGHKDNHPEYFL